MRAEGERYSSCWVKQIWEYFILITELRVLPFLCAWNWSGSLGGSLGGSIFNRMRAEGERYSSCWVKQTWEYFILITELRVTHSCVPGTGAVP